MNVSTWSIRNPIPAVLLFVLLSVLGGVLGILCGIGASELGSLYMGFPTLIAPWSIAVAVGVSTGIGLIFGFFPAFKASQLDPIEALRYE